MGKTLLQKVWDLHTVRRLPTGQTQLFIGLHLVHEVTTPQAIVIPGCVSPSSGPMTCTMPCLSLSRFQSGMPNSAQFRSSADSIASASGS